MLRDVELIEMRAPYVGAIKAGPGSQSLSHRPSLEQCSWGHLRPRRQAPPWEWGCSESGLGHGPMGRPSWAGPRAEHGRAVGIWWPVKAGGWETLRPCSSLAGAGAYGPGLMWGRGALGELGRDSPAWQCPEGPVSQYINGGN